MVVGWGIVGGGRRVRGEAMIICVYVTEPALYCDFSYAFRVASEFFFFFFFANRRT